MNGFGLAGTIESEQRIISNTDRCMVSRQAYKIQAPVYPASMNWIYIVLGRLAYDTQNKLRVLTLLTIQRSHHLQRVMRNELFTRINITGVATSEKTTACLNSLCHQLNDSTSSTNSS